MKSICLLADPKTPAWDFSKKVQDYITKRDKKHQLPLYKIDTTIFENKEIMPYVPDNIRKQDVYYVQSSNKNPSDWWVELLLMKDLCLSASAKSLTLVLPTMLYTRQDRKHKSRVPISARALARSLYSPKLSRVITMDLHAPQIQGFFPEEVPVDNLYSFPVLVKDLMENHSDLLENLVVASPDAGGVSRAISFAKRMLKENKFQDPEKMDYDSYFAFTHKLRLRPGEVEKMWFIGDVKDKNVLVVDDMFDTCGTMIKSGKKFKENGAAKIIAYGTGGFFTKGIDDIANNFDLVITSNTHYIPNQEETRIKTLDVTPLFGEAIYRAQKGISISELFE